MTWKADGMLHITATPKRPLIDVMGLALRAAKRTQMHVGIKVIDESVAFDLCRVNRGGLVMLSLPTLQVPIRYLKQLAAAVHKYDLMCPVIGDLTGIIEDLKERKWNKKAIT